MSEIYFLSVEEVLALHDDAIEFAGGETGLRSMELLESALGQPEAGFGDQYANPFPFGMAAAYAFHLSRNHPFVDGNKRIGLSAALVFLFMHGWEVVDPDETLHPIMEDVAQGKVDKPTLAAVFARLSVKVEPT